MCKTTMEMRFLGVGQICRHNNVKNDPTRLPEKWQKIRFLFVDHKYHTTTCTLSYFSFFSIFVLQVSYCLNISRGQMFWWWGRRDIWKRVGIFNLFFFGRKKILVLFVVGLPPQKGAKMGSFLKIASSKAMARRSTNYGAPFFFNGCVGSF